MELEKVYLVWNIVNTFIVTMLALYTYATNRTKARNEAITNLGDSVDELEKRTTAMETSIKHLPNRQDMNTLHKRVTELAASVQESTGSQKRIGRQVDLIYSHLINNKGSE